jgi:hypothetical protein
VLKVLYTLPRVKNGRKNVLSQAVAVSLDNLKRFAVNLFSQGKMAFEP